MKSGNQSPMVAYTIGQSNYMRMVHGEVDKKLRRVYDFATRAVDLQVCNAGGNINVVGASYPALDTHQSRSSPP